MRRELLVAHNSVHMLIKAEAILIERHATRSEGLQTSVDAALATCRQHRGCQLRRAVVSRSTDLCAQTRVAGTPRTGRDAG
eukprot:5937896-Pleurochrysis_carterae.AAC.5